jgi:hypothetical protein
MHLKLQKVAKIAHQKLQTFTKIKHQKWENFKGFEYLEFQISGIHSRASMVAQLPTFL